MKKDCLTTFSKVDFNTFEPEEEIDLNEVAAEIRKLQSEIKDIDAELKPYFDELGLDFPFDVEGK